VVTAPQAMMATARPTMAGVYVGDGKRSGRGLDS
jgi:hypothetical protein